MDHCTYFNSVPLHNSDYNCYPQYNHNYLIQIKNSLWFQIAVYLFDKSSNFIDKLGEIGSGQVYDLPVQAVANNNMVLKFGAGLVYQYN